MGISDNYFIAVDILQCCNAKYLTKTNTPTINIKIREYPPFLKKVLMPTAQDPVRETAVDFWEEYEGRNFFFWGETLH